MNKKSLIQLLLTVAFITIWSGLVFFVGATTIVNFIGVDNSYIAVFIIGMLGGVSTFTSASFYTAFSTFASGGINPLYLGIVAGISVSLGDSLFYFIGNRGNYSLPSKAQHAANKFSEWMKEKPCWAIQLVTFIYAGFTPLPNDILTVSLGLAKYRYRLIVIPLILGNILIMTVFAYTTVKFF